MNNLVNGIIILAVIAALVLSIIALVQCYKSDFEDDNKCSLGDDIKATKLCKKLCDNAYKPGITYHTSCVNYCSASSNTALLKTYKNMCNYCKNCKLSNSGYNTACQYFSGPFINPKNPNYGKKMPDSWKSDPNCVK